MRYTVFAAFRAILLLLLASVNFNLARINFMRDYEFNEFAHVEPGVDDDDLCSDQIITELDEIRADLRDVKSLMVGLRKKLDPDFKPGETEQPTAEPGPCPEGFDHLPESRGCYKVIEEKRDWSSAKEQCQSLNAHLISVDSRKESEDVTKYLNKKFASRRARRRCHREHQHYGHSAFWTSGQRVNTSDCGSEFVWKTTADGEIPLNYTQWIDKEPNCYEGDEKCVEILLDGRSDWNDISCNYHSCSLCEYDLN